MHCNVSQCPTFVFKSSANRRTSTSRCCCCSTKNFCLTAPNSCSSLALNSRFMAANLSENNLPISKPMIAFITLKQQYNPAGNLNSAELYCLVGFSF